MSDLFIDPLGKSVPGNGKRIYHLRTIRNQRDRNSLPYQINDKWLLLCRTDDLCRNRGQQWEPEQYKRRDEWEYRKCNGDACRRSQTPIRSRRWLSTEYPPPVIAATPNSGLSPALEI